jgi:hypothetical protein
MRHNKTVNGISNFSNLMANVTQQRRVRAKIFSWLYIVCTKKDLFIHLVNSVCKKYEHHL